jgi:glyoxylase-like metal-dependent hydrolase (beta-lactamase superfamily II)
VTVPARRTRLLTAIAGAGLLTAAGAAQQPGLQQDVEILEAGPMRIEEVAAGLYVIRGPFVPCTTRGCRPGGPDDGLIHEPGDVALRVTPDGVILVDDKYPDNLVELLALVRSVTDQPIRYLLNSHHHGDHVSGNANFQALGVDVIGHRNIRTNFLRTSAPGAPTLTFADEAAVHLGGVEVRLHHLGRGHTSGDTVIEFPDLRAVHMGDLVIDGMPVVDYAGGGSALAFIDTIDRLLELEFDIAIPGHGRVMTSPEVRAYRERFAEMNDRMRALVRAGVPREAVATLEGARARLGLADLGWDDSVSTTASLNGLPAIYDEIAADLAAAP